MEKSRLLIAALARLAAVQGHSPEALPKLALSCKARTRTEQIAALPHVGIILAKSSVAARVKPGKGQERSAPSWCKWQSCQD